MSPDVAQTLDVTYCVRMDRLLTTKSLGLRHRQAQQLRIEIAQAAVRCFLQAGFEQTTVNDIADECGVSRRTVFRHFATKEDILLAWPLASADTLRDEVKARPAGPKPMECLREILVAFAESSASRVPELYAIARLIQGTASLRGRSHEVTDAWQDAIRDGVVARNISDEPRATIMVVVAIATARLGARRWLEAGASRSLARFIDEAFDELLLMHPDHLNATSDER